MTGTTTGSGLTCGIDVGGTKIAGGVVAADGTLLELARVESPARNSTAIAQAIAGLVADLATRHPVEAVGVGAAGFVDAGRSTVMFAPNLAWRDEPLRDAVASRVGLPVVVENDANAAAWGEFAFGAGRDVDDLLFVGIGTGIGGGIVHGGRLNRGAYGVAAEIGHLRVEPGGRPCGCGQLGCWEQYGSGSALVRQTRLAAQADPAAAAALLERVGGDAGRIQGPAITLAAQEGDAFAVARFVELGRWIGEGIASLASVLDPAMTVIGGGVSSAGDLLLDPVREAFASHLSARAYRPEMVIRPAELGNDAGVIGAADLARR